MLYNAFVKYTNLFFECGSKTHLISNDTDELKFLFLLSHIKVQHVFIQFEGILN